MKVFISWSGTRGKALAEALAEWIPNVLQAVKCFYSDEGIRAGQRWNNEINSELEATDFGILCVTPENVRAPWLNFEAGAIAKRASLDSRVVPVTLGFLPSLLDPPLNQFNGVEATAEGIKSLIKSLDEVAATGINVDQTFEVWWPALKEKLDELPAPEADADVAPPAPPSTEEKLSEVLGVVQGIQRDLLRTRADLRDRGKYADPAEAFVFMRFAHMMQRDPRVTEAVADGDITTIRRFIRTAQKRAVEDVKYDSLLNSRLWTDKSLRDASGEVAPSPDYGDNLDDSGVDDERE